MRRSIMATCTAATVTIFGVVSATASQEFLFYFSFGEGC
jgi:hypothetical protein